MNAEDKVVKSITKSVQENFSTFGGERDVSGSNNPIAHLLKNKPAMFAAGVSVEDVVRFVMQSMIKAN